MVSQAPTYVRLAQGCLHGTRRSWLRLKKGATVGELGLDRNVGQATDSQDHVGSMTDMALLDTRIRRTQRPQA